MPTGNAYPSGHLVPSPILGLANAPIVETKFLELAMSLLDFSPRIPLGTFSNLLVLLFDLGLRYQYIAINVYREASNAKNNNLRTCLIDNAHLGGHNVFAI